MARTNRTLRGKDLLAKAMGKLAGRNNRSVQEENRRINGSSAVKRSGPVKPEKIKNDLNPRSNRKQG